MNDDDDSELFEGAIEVSSLERGSTFGLSEETYFRLATFAITASGLRIEPAVICTLPSGERGCKLVLFGKTHAFNVRVRVFRSSTMIDVFAEPLDGLRCEIPLYSGEDLDCHWSRALRSMCAVEQIGYFDSHSAAEQQQGEGGDEATT